MPHPAPLRALGRHLSLALCLATAAAVLLPSTPAQAEDKAYRELKRINNSINSVRRSFPKTVGARLDYEGKVIKNLGKRLASQRAKLTPDLKVQKAAYKSVIDNLTDAEAYVKVLEKVHAAARQIADVRSSHRAGRPVTAQKLKQLDDAVARLRAAKSPNWSEAADKWAKTAGELRASNPEVAASAKTKAAEKASGKRRQAAKTARWNLDRAMSRNEEITPALIKAFEDTVAPMKGVDGEMATYFSAELDRYRAQAAWDIHGDRAAGEIANILGGKLIQTGVTKGKKMKAKLPAAADRCYAVFMRYKRWSGAEKINDLEFNWKSKRPLQEFGVYQNGRWKTPRVRGFCTVAKATVSMTAGLEFAGTKNGVRYALIEWTRDTFPLALAGRISLYKGDSCDFQHWFDLWDKPVPGTFAYSGTQPVLVTRSAYLTGNNGYVGARGLGIGFGDFALGKARGMTGAPPRAIAIKTKNQFRKCVFDHKNPKASSLSKRISKCHASIDKKYASQWRSINRIRDAARRQHAVSPSAERRADRLSDKQSRDRRRRCGPIEKKATATAAKTYDRLADAMADKMYKPRLDRASYIRQIMK